MTPFNFLWKREYSLYYGVASMYGLIEWLDKFITHRTEVKGERQDGWFSCYSTGNSVDQLKLELRKLITDNTYQKEIDRLHKTGKEFVDYAKNLKYDSKTPLQQLKKYYSEYFQLIAEYCDCLWVGFYLPEQAGEVFQKFLKQALPPDKVDEALEAYSMPSGKAMLFQIADAFAKEKDEKKKILIIKKKFPWIKTMDPFLNPANDQEIKEFVHSFSLNIKPAKDPVQLANHPLTKMYQEMLYLKDLRDDYRRESFYYIHPFMIELAKRLNLTMEELGLTLPGEIPLSKGELTLRKQACSVELKNNKRIVFSGPDALKHFEGHQSTSENSIIKGIIGFKGIVKGMVQIIKSREDIAKFKKGNILVAITTNPNHLPAMQKASAFVTDEGGITCHAAIVARELKIPCIIGTKSATKVLKDGDIVEVDANSGMIRKI